MIWVFLGRRGEKQFYFLIFFYDMFLKKHFTKQKLKWLINLDEVLKLMKYQEMQIESSILIFPQTGKNEMSNDIKVQ